MRIRAALLALVLMGSASPLAAQARPPGIAPRAPTQGPFELLLAHRAALGLDEAQVERVLEIRAAVEERNAPLVARLVAMRREIGPGVAPRAMSRRERAEFRYRLQTARPLVEQIRANNRAAMRAIGDVLTESQRNVLRGLVEQRRERGVAPRRGPPGARGPGG